MISAFLDDEYLYLLMQGLVSLYKSNIVNARVSTFSWSERWNVAPCCLQLPASTKRLSSQCRQLFDRRVIRALQRDTESLSLSTFWSFILTPLVGLDHFWLWRSQWLNRNVKSLYKLYSCFVSFVSHEGSWCSSSTGEWHQKRRCEAGLSEVGTKEKEIKELCIWKRATQIHFVHVLLRRPFPAS